MIACAPAPSRFVLGDQNPYSRPGAVGFCRAPEVASNIHRPGQVASKNVSLP